MHTHSDSTHSVAPQHGGLHRNQRPLIVALAITATVMVAEVVGGAISGSLALLADAGHMASDVAALALSVTAMWMAQRPHTARRSYGYMRMEVVAALLNGLALWLVVAYIFWEAIQRFASPREVQGGLLLGVASLGLVANLASAALLAKNSHESINTRGALLHVLGDALGSIGAIVAGTLALAFGWYIADPIVSVIIGVIVLIGSIRLVREAVSVLLESSPQHVDTIQLQKDIEALPNVKGVHDIHAWTLTSGYDAMSAHVLTAEGCSQPEARRVLDDVRHLAANRYGIIHVTVQLEGDDCDCVEEAHLANGRWLNWRSQR